MKVSKSMCHLNIYQFRKHFHCQNAVLCMIFVLVITNRREVNASYVAVVLRTMCLGGGRGNDCYIYVIFTKEREINPIRR